jgi:Tfp pilus assembly protein PilX
MRLAPGGNRASFARGLDAARRNGFALAAALLGLLLIAALVAGVLFATTEETRIGRASADREVTLLAAESAIEMTIAAWSVADTETVDVAGMRSSTLEGLGAPVTVYVTRLDSALYWIVADAGDHSPGSESARRIGTVVTMRTAPDGSITIDRIPEHSWSELF